MDEKRPTHDETIMKIVEILSKRSTCRRIQTATVITNNEGHIISSGYNGVTSGSKHCYDIWKGDEDNFKHKHHEWSQYNELHAERNAIYMAARDGVSLKGSNLYTLYSPCINCAMSIITVGIKKVYFKILYDNDNYAIEYLKKNNIELIELNI
jgi:dCMP deaminase